MTPVHAILVVIIRLWAAGVILAMLGGLPSHIIAILGGAHATDLFATGYFFRWLLLLVSGLVGWFAAPWFARRVFSPESDKTVTIDVNAEDLVAIGSFLIGAFYLVQYGPRLVVELISIFLEY